LNGWCVVFLFTSSKRSVLFQLTRFGYMMEISLRASVRVFNAANAADAERVPIFEHEFDVGTLVLPRGEQPNQGGVEGEGGEGREGEGREGEDREGEGREV
jgi:hypothetical protein